ncbi:OmpA family protein [Entomomonas moraniae]|uniref:OmpA family protein n=1 Tax=Entomomonas moraniae TaxID=2213226 RepID=A0A3S9XEA0_9GAMM|nr:OmpA family protein [Entomomonas moraniae]AZS50793.1 OmpA family protein [Entomomonas moraniae]
MIKLNFTKYAIISTVSFLLVACSNSEQKPKEIVQVKRGNVTYTSIGLNTILVKQAVAESNFEVVERGDSIVVIMPVKGSFNPKRPDVLMPVTLTPLTKIAKLVKQDTSKVMIIVGHTDATGTALANNTLSAQRAKSVGSVFSVAGLPRSRMYATGVGSNQPISSAKTAKGREQNRRVELIIAPRSSRSMDTLPNLYAVTNY